MSALSADDFDERLAIVDSGDRARVLVEVLQEVDSPEIKRVLLRDWFNMCDALAPYREALREQFLLAGFVTDVPEDPIARALQDGYPATVYRGAWEDDETELALSWTLDRATAEGFCRIISGPRGMFLGIRRTDVEPHVFQGVCTAAYGYIGGRSEQEVIAAKVTAIEAIAALRAVPEPGKV